jgi:hypothetical protein
MAYDASCYEKARKGVGQMIEIIGTGWKNGSGFPAGGAGYGIKIDYITDRRSYFARGRVKLHLDGLPTPVYVNTDKPSFWTASCGELISAEIGRWTRSRGLYLGTAARQSSTFALYRAANLKCGWLDEADTMPWKPRPFATQKDSMRRLMLQHLTVSLPHW